ncbi:MAG: radical SAM protein, partial [Candidatus Binatia bacterium]|nr:radical SAM protein [Candidatus Binatia bacterium]
MKAERLLKDAFHERPLKRNEAIELSAVREDEFAQLLEIACELRHRHKGKTVTFSPKVFVPLTNLCRNFCGYCTFRRAPEEAGAKTMTLEEVLQVATQGKRLGCTEVLFSLGDRPEAIYPEMRHFLAQSGYQRTLDYLYDACHVVLEKTGLLPHSNPGLMGRKDLRRLKEVNISLGLMLENISDRFGRLYDPHKNAPDKKGSLRLKTIEEAGK